MKLRKRKGGKVRVQIHVRFKRPSGMKITAEFLKELVEEWAETGETPTGVEITPVVWSGPGRREKRAVDAHEIDEVRDKLVRRVVQRAYISYRPVLGKDKANG